jgi:RNA polymerase sigma factor (sigma-70 family)
VTPDERARIQAWMVQAADGDRAAFDPLFSALWPAVRALCARLAGGDGDDAAQEAMVRVFTRAAEFDPDRDAASWVLAIAGWECRTVRRRRVRRRDGADLPDSAVAGERPDDGAERRELLAAVGEILGELSPTDAETLTAAWLGDREAGPTFRKRLERALARFRAAWRSRHDVF